MNVETEAKIRANRLKFCSRFRDLTGLTFGNWLVIKEVPRKHPHIIRYLCLCNKCNKEYEVSGRSLTSGQSKQCLECRLNRNNRATKTETYWIWSGMKSRCNNPKVKIYPWYGGRGIKVCERWNKFQNFLEDMGERPDKLELDRINNDGNYEPGNCRWVTKQVNFNNRRPSSSLVGKKIGHWTILEYIKYPNQTHKHYKCRCDCGFEAIRVGSDLTRRDDAKCRNCQNIAHRNWPSRLKREV